ncbi:hypothetical protein C4D60_Mb08t27320 [Musa balbisiana]|uniref:Uncharacterized protein n=1 Tax=Musa balbisiana TaxID=52838 RepID=A0A4S8K6W0_MUSBA|nr:hypothetical protein C4D60_Mb08t27320 [Musa balbisiana]
MENIMSHSSSPFLLSNNMIPTSALQELTNPRNKGCRIVDLSFKLQTCHNNSHANKIRGVEFAFLQCEVINLARGKYFYVDYHTVSLQLREEPKFREIRAWHHPKLAFDPMRATNVSNLNKFGFLIVTSFFARAKNAFSGDGYRLYQKGS